MDSWFVALRRLLVWWLRLLRLDAVRGAREWKSEPEWPLLVVGSVFFASYLLHWLGYRLAIHRVGWGEPFFLPAEWEGRTGWRKPLVFGLSNAMVFISLRQALRSQGLVSRRFASHLAAWSTAVEVGIITLQAWRGVPSHFNTETVLDTSLYAVKMCGVMLLGLACFLAAAGVLARPASASVAQLASLRHGLLLMCVSVLVGVAQVVYGHTPRSARAEEEAPCLVATAGATGSPCYEIHGKAIVKLAHFLPLHATEVLLLLAWATHQLPCCDGPRLVRLAALGCWSIAVLGIWQTLQGEDFKSFDQVYATVVAVASLSCILLPCLFVFIAPVAVAPHKLTIH